MPELSEHESAGRGLPDAQHVSPVALEATEGGIAGAIAGTVKTAAEGAVEGPSAGRLGLLLFGILAAVSIIDVALYNFVLPPSLMARLAEQETGLATASSQIDSIEKFQWVGYLLAPIGLGLRLGLVALIVQGVGLLVASELRFGAAFAAATAGAFATVYGTWMNLLWLWRAGPNGISLDVLGVAPVSLAGFFMAADSSRTVMYRAAAEVGVPSIMWVVLVGLTLRTYGRLSWKAGVAVGAFAWLGLATGRTVLNAVVLGLMPQ